MQNEVNEDTTGKAGQQVAEFQALRETIFRKLHRRADKARMV